jgi:hypothetical protein
MARERDSARIDGLKRRVPLRPKQQVEKLIDGRRSPVVIESAEVVDVAEPAFDFGGAEPGLEWLVGGRCAQQSGERFVALLRCMDEWPIADQAAQHGRFAPRHDLAFESFAIDRLMFGDRAHRVHSLAERPTVR